MLDEMFHTLKFLIHMTHLSPTWKDFLILHSYLQYLHSISLFPNVFQKQLKKKYIYVLYILNIFICFKQINIFIFKFYFLIEG